MTIQEIKEILLSDFESAEDRKYWEDRLKAEERKLTTRRENDAYFRKNAAYNR